MAVKCIPLICACDKNEQHKRAVYAHNDTFLSVVLSVYIIIADYG